MSLLPNPEKYASEVRDGFRDLLCQLENIVRLLQEIQDELISQRSEHSSN